MREEADRRGWDHARSRLIAVGNDLRRREGPGVLARRIRARLRGRDVIDSIRNPAEVAELRRTPGFVLLGVDALIAIRFERSRQRGRPGDGDRREEFKKREEEENTRDPAAQQLRATLALADARVINAGTLEDLHREVDRLLAEWDDDPSTDA